MVSAGLASASIIRMDEGKMETAEKEGKSQCVSGLLAASA